MKITAQLILLSRLDRYLKKLYPCLSQGVIEKALRLKQITVNEQKVLASFKVKDGDQVSFSDFFSKQNIMPNESQKASKAAKVYPKSVIKLAEKILVDYLLYEDENVLIINKPNNLSSQGGSKVKLSIDDALNYLNEQQNKNLRLVHRLDKETSGCFVIAKNYLASVKLAQAFKDKIISKIYQAISLGFPAKDQGEITNLIAKSRGGVYEAVVEDKVAGRLAITQYKLLKKYGNLAHLEFKPLTGRMHQLRFHAKALGAAILGDYKYSLQNKLGNSAQLSENMLLHAVVITIPAGIFGQEISAQAELPLYFKKFMQ